MLGTPLLSRFVVLNAAYEVLKDPDTRKKYDRMGKKGLEESEKRGGGGGNGGYQDYGYPSLGLNS